MTVIVRGVELRIVDGALYKEVVAPDNQHYLERYVGEDITIDEVEEVR